MCGRFALITPPDSLRKLLDFSNQANFSPNFSPRFNIAPTQPITIVKQVAGHREASLVTWGLIPAWLKPDRVEEMMKKPQHNARGETVSEKPFFKTSFQHHRCLIPADAFYEWNPKTRQPYCVRKCDQEPFMMAGIWAQWSGADGSEIESCAVITTVANETLSPVHHRMPVMVSSQNWDRWFTTAPQKSARLQELLVPAAEEDFAAYPIARDVNRVANDSSDLWRQVTPEQIADDQPEQENKKPTEQDGQMDLF